MDPLSKNVSYQAGTTILTIRPILIAPTFAPHNLLLKVVMRIFRIPLSRDTIKSKVRILRRLKTIFKNSKNALWTCPVTLSNHLFSLQENTSSKGLNNSKKVRYTHKVVT